MVQVPLFSLCFLSNESDQELRRLHPRRRRGLPQPDAAGTAPSEAAATLPSDSLDVVACFETTYRRFRLPTTSDFTRHIRNSEPKLKREHGKYWFEEK
ncbi:hypothetical protein LXL04_012993 [Taraxacum kok-saghyz]